MKAEGFIDGYVQKGRHWVHSHDMVGGKIWGKLIYMKAEKVLKETRMLAIKQKFFNFA